jgi:hypothetical protein
MGMVLLVRKNEGEGNGVDVVVVPVPLPLDEGVGELSGTRLQMSC